ncbi:MAG: hypothetical protein JNL67_18190 [Planctomycetaceae bacterium]|nr:hypothetical protein [Planctomycetaceae bacterium]
MIKYFRRWAVFTVLVLLLFGHMWSVFAQQPDYSIPMLDLQRVPEAYTVVDREAGKYLGHPTTVLFADGKTILCAYPSGHGRGQLLMSRSTDAGDSWQRIDLGKARVDEVPTLFKLPLPSAKLGERVIMVTCTPGKGVLEWMWSDDLGSTWSPRKSWQLEGTKGIIVALSSLWSVDDGKWRGVFHDYNFDNWTVDLEMVTDEKAWGGVDCRFSNLRRVDYATSDGLKKARGAGLCEAGVVASPDHKRLALLFRPQHKKTNAMIAFSDDAGLSWTDPSEMAGSLTGERHTARYAPDGRLVVFFRDYSPRNKTNPSHGDWVAWIGTWDDLLRTQEGQCRLLLKRNYGNSTNNNIGDCGYTGVEVLPDGRVLGISYGHWDVVRGSTHPNHSGGRGQAPYILQVRFHLNDVDKWLKDKSFRVAPLLPKGQQPVPNASSSATLKLDRIFGSGMVLPHDREFTISGSAQPHHSVTVELAGQELMTVSGGDGRWQVNSKALPISTTGCSLVVRSADHTISLDDILVGKLWLCAGQSNMDWPLARAVGGTQEANEAKSFGMIRLYNATAPPTDNRVYDAGLIERLASGRRLAGVVRDSDYYDGQWQSAASANAFSAIGWWTARLVHEATDHPIGVVDVSVGGSGIEAWLAPESLNFDSRCQAWNTTAWIDDANIGSWMRGRAKRNLGRHLAAAHPYRPTILFEQGVRPWMGLPFHQVIWYQGESNAEIGDQDWNTKLIVEMVQGWREVLGQPELPFVMVQLPEIGGNDPLRAHWPAFREAQAKATQQLEHAHLVVTKDLGWPDSADVHPPDKRPIAERIAAVVLSNR